MDELVVEQEDVKRDDNYCLGPQSEVLERTQLQLVDEGFAFLGVHLLGLSELELFPEVVATPRTLIVILLLFVLSIALLVL